jgi:hypothetical protein
MTDLVWLARLREHVKKLFVFSVFETEFEIDHKIFVTEVFEVKQMLVLSFFTAVIQLHVAIVAHDAFIQSGSCQSLSRNKIH